MAALSDTVRVAIVLELSARGESTCGSFELGVSKATRSHHFKVLREAGLTRTRAEGTHRYVSLRRDEVDERFPGLLGAVLDRRRGGVGAYRGPFLIAELAIFYQLRARVLLEVHLDLVEHALLDPLNGRRRARAAAAPAAGSALAAVGQRRPCEVP